MSLAPDPLPVGPRPAIIAMKERAVRAEITPAENPEAELSFLRWLIEMATKHQSDRREAA